MRNKVELIGRLGKDPEIRNLDNGKMVANFSMATTEKWKNERGEKVEKTEWHNIVCWGKLCEILQKYVKKGDLLFVEGKLTTRMWEKDGVKHYVTEVLIDGLLLLPNERRPKDNSSTGYGNSASSGHATPSSGVATDDLPF